ncbi:hypothetical protein BGZ80_010768 [Entomortierella chlamydospora]|uniref:Uncharacterized protein n=1 Tax=Entomortierella chlamydospora TaxID=101097 RepID=A0A9P6SZL9_9FUNG|nr:hypothetical protein BGZ80_010768 [Entomortierella chlamydospora]
MTSNKHSSNKRLSRSTRSSRNRTHNKYRNHNRNHRIWSSSLSSSWCSIPSVSPSESSLGDWTDAEDSTHELAEDQRLSRLAQFIFIKLKDDETYRRFAWRIAREVKVCRIKDDDNIALAAMTSALPYYTRNTMNLALWIKKNEKTRFTSIKDFIEILSDMEGPDPKPALVYNKCCCQEQQQQ